MERKKHEVLNEVESHVGTLGWLAIFGFTLAFDSLSKETITNAYKRGREHPIGRFAVRAGALYTLAHLEDLIPEPFDLFDNTADVLGRIINKTNREVEE